MLDAPPRVQHVPYSSCYSFPFYVEAQHTRLLNRVVIPSLCLTMLAQDLQFLRDLRSGLEVAGVSVACDQTQRFLLATTGNQNRRMWPREALRQVEWALDTVVLS